MLVLLFANANHAGLNFQSTSHRRGRGPGFQSHCRSARRDPPEAIADSGPTLRTPTARKKSILRPDQTPIPTGDERYEEMRWDNK